MIELRQVSKRFDRRADVAALSDVSLSIPRGQMVSIVGPSGVGQVHAPQPDRRPGPPSAGEIHIDGDALASLSDDGLTRVRRDKIGFVFQFFNLLPDAHLSGERRAAAPSAGAGPARKSRRERRNY
jgi:putative ABC transport system ATP-binding protein